MYYRVENWLIPKTWIQLSVFHRIKSSNLPYAAIQNPTPNDAPEASQIRSGGIKQILFCPPNSQLFFPYAAKNQQNIHEIDE